MTEPVDQPPADPRKLLRFSWFDPHQDTQHEPAISIRVFLHADDGPCRLRVRSELSQALYRLMNQIDQEMNDA